MKGEHSQLTGSRSPTSFTSDICMEIFMDLELKTELEPRIWKRYTDDTFCVTEAVKATHFLELEKDRGLPLLGTLLT